MNVFVGHSGVIYTEGIVSVLSCFDVSKRGRNSDQASRRRVADPLQQSNTDARILGRNKTAEFGHGLSC